MHIIYNIHRQNMYYIDIYNMHNILSHLLLVYIAFSNFMYVCMMYVWDTRLQDMYGS